MREMRRAVDRGRRALAIAQAAALVGVLIASPSMADEFEVPVSMQTSLLTRIATYDRNFAARAGTSARVLVLSRGGSPDAERGASVMTEALRKVPTIAGLPVQMEAMTWSGARPLVDACKAGRIAIIYVAPGFADEIPKVVSALDELDVLSVAGTPRYVEAGVGVGFDVKDGHPKIVVNLTHARRQHADLAAALLKIARIVQ